MDAETIAAANYWEFGFKDEEGWWSFEMTFLAGQLARMVVRYSSVEFPYGIIPDELELQEGRLMLYQTPKGSFPTEAVPVPPPPPPIPVAPYDKDYLIVLEGDSKTVQAEIVRRPDGSIGWLRWGSRVHRRVN